MPNPNPWIANGRRAVAAPAAHKPAAAPGPIAQARAVQADTDQAEFERQANTWAKPNTVRPAFLTADEAIKLNLDYGTGQGKLKAMTALVQIREARWQEMTGADPIRQLDPLERQSATGFFTVNGVELAPAPAHSLPATAPAPTGPKQAPPNPIKAKDEAERAAAAIAEQPKPAPTRDPAPAPESHQDADRAIVQAEAKPAPAPALAQAGKAPTSPPHLEIEFMDLSGYIDRLTVYPDSSIDEIAAVMKLGTKVRESLLKAGFTQTPAPKASAGPAAPSADNPPKCRYHGAMKESKKPGSWFCPKKLGDGTYCDQKVEA